MIVIVDGFWLNKPRGLGTYAQAIVKSLTQLNNSDVEVFVVIPRGLADTITSRSRAVKFLKVPAVPYPIWENVVLPFIAWRKGADILHCPNNTGPIVPLSCKLLVTVHDLIFFDSLGTTIYQKLGNVYRSLVIRRLAKSTANFITVSNTSARDIYKRLQVRAIPLITPVDPQASTSCESLFEKGSYYLHIGGEAQHKNTRRVIQAFRSLASTQKLVILGLPAESKLAVEFSDVNIIFPGWVSDEIKWALYRNALAIIFPSLVEGYGLPIVEAFASSVPVITSDREPMSEVAADAAIFVNPECISSIADGIQKVTNSQEMRDDLIEKGRRRLLSMDFKTFGNSLLDIYLAAR